LSPLLNLADADLSGFEAVLAGTYEAQVHEVTWKETSGKGKLPKGTPMLNVQFKLDGTDEEGKSVKNRRVFYTLVIPPEKINGKAYEHAGMMKANLVRFLIAIGYSKEEVMGGSFDPDPDDMKGRNCRVVVARREYVPEGVDPETNPEDVQIQNEVKSVKPPSDEQGSGLL
jgi:hypothetical protein